MTVCIAAICQGPAYPYIIGASDRKVTAGDVQFEPHTPKVWQLGTSIAAMIAGDSDAQTEICTRVVVKKPQTVRQAVDWYCRELGHYNRKQAERKVLSNLGLTMRSFLDRQQSMSAEFSEQLRYEINQEKAEVNTIICGLDSAGLNIYTIDHHARAYCNSAIGFAAIGDGERHASSQFMVARYTPRIWQVEPALLLLYTAKKNAEAAPGVGEKTDMFFIAHPDGLLPLSEEMVAALESAYQAIEKARSKAVEDAGSAIAQFIEYQAGQSAEPSPQEPILQPPPKQKKLKKPRGKRAEQQPPDGSTDPASPS